MPRKREPFPCVPIHAARTLSDPLYVGLSNEERGVWVTLSMYQWGASDGMLSGDLSTLAALANCTVRVVTKVLKTMFTKRGGRRYVNEDVYEEWLKACRWRDKSRRGGKSTSKKRPRKDLGAGKGGTPVVPQNSEGWYPDGGGSVPLPLPLPSSERVAQPSTVTERGSVGSPTAPPPPGGGQKVPPAGGDQGRPTGSSKEAASGSLHGNQGPASPGGKVSLRDDDQASTTSMERHPLRGRGEKRQVAKLLNGYEEFIDTDPQRVVDRVMEYDLAPDHRFAWACVLQSQKSEGRRNPAGHLVKMLTEPNFTPSDKALDRAKQEEKRASEGGGSGGILPIGDHLSDLVPPQQEEA